MAVNHVVRIMQTTKTPEYDMRGINIDLSRKTGVLIRQSKKGADVDSRESRLRQESLVPVAISLRGDEDGANIILYDEGSGVSGTKGYDQRPELSRLYLDISNGVIGSIVVARADRLFRDKHFRDVSMFTELAERQHLILIVPGRAVYDFTKTRDLQSFQREMQEAYSYIATQVAYMHDTRQQKVQRGRYGGGNLPAPYAIDRSMDRDQQVPVIYRPWLPTVVDLFERFKNYDFVLARIARYIEEQTYIFPFPSADDLQRYMFKTLMRRVPGGYTFTSGTSMRRYFSNLTLAGYAKIGKDGDGNLLFLADAFEPAVPLDLLGESYAAITGHYLDGSSFSRKKYAVRGRTVTQDASSAILHGFLASDDGAVSYVNNNEQERPLYRCYEGGTVAGGAVNNRIGIMRAHMLWPVACEDLEHIVVQRLCELSRYDGDMSDRIKSIWEQRKSSETSEAELLAKQLERVEAQIRRYDDLLTDATVPLTLETKRRYVEMLTEAEADKDRLRKKQTAQEHLRDPGELLPDFYYVLSHLPTEYKRLTSEGQKRMARHVIHDIHLNRLSAHIFLLRVTWQSGIALCPDVALVWRGATTNNNGDWTEEEDDLMRALYPESSQVDLMHALPRWAWGRIQERAQVLGVRRAVSHGNNTARFNAYYRTIRYDDFETVERLADTPEQQGRLRRVVNDLARQTVRGSLSAHWWLPLESVSYAGNAENIPALPTLTLGKENDSSPAPW